MKNIFIAIDLSDNAAQAAVYVAQAAQPSKARLILFHTYNTADYPKNLSERWVQKQLDKLARKLHSATGLSVTRFIKPGTSVTDALKIAVTVQADLAVICNEQQAALATIQTSGLPVIIVPTSSPVDAQKLSACLAEKLKTSALPAVV